MANQKRLQAQNSLGNESEDAGITFTARSHANGGSMSSSKHPSSFKGSPDKCSTVGSKSPDETSQTSKQTIAETMLPWRRNSTLRRSSGSGSVTGTAISGSTTGAAAVGSSTSGTNTTGGSFDSQSSVTGLSTGPLKQEEFPPWINNKEYLIGYCSPTNTILRNIDLSKQNTRMPTVHEIFSINGSEGQLNTGSTNPDLESGDYRRRSQPIIGSPASQAFASTASASAAPMPPPPPLPTLPPNATSTPVLSTFAPVQHAPFRTGSGTRFNITLSSQALDQRTLAGDDLSSVQVVDGSQSTDNIRLDLQEDPNTHPIYRL